MSDMFGNMTSSMSFALRGTFVHAPDFGIVEVLQDTVCFVSGRRCGGRILAMCPAAEADNTMQELGLQITVHNIPVKTLKTLRSSFYHASYFQGYRVLAALCVMPLTDS